MPIVQLVVPRIRLARLARVMAVLGSVLLPASVAVALPITYQGELRGGGAPLSGAYDMTLRLTDSEVDGLLLQQVAIADVQVVDGLFTVRVDFDDSWFDGSDRWLALVVEGESLAPRQRVTYTPLAIFADRARIANTVQVPLTLIGGTVVVEGFAEDPAGVGLRGVHLAGTGTAPGVLGQTNSATNGAAGILGEVAITAPGSLSAGVRGINRSTSTLGIGVYGSHDGAGWGVYGVSASGRGVYGTSTSGVGMRGNTSSGTGVEANAVSGTALRATHSVSGTTAALGRSDYGVYAENLGEDGEGTALFASGGRVGVHGNAPGGGFGLDLTRIGVQGTAGDYSTGAMHIYGVRGSAQAPFAGGGRFAYGVSGSAQSGSSASTGFGIVGESVGPGVNWAGYFRGNVHVQGTLSKAAGAFMIDHPQDPENKLLSHSFVESPEMLNVYSGTATLDGAGCATVALPSYFDALNGSCRYQLTPIGCAMRDLHVAEEVSANTFRIGGGAPGGKVSWQVSGVRKDPAAVANAIKVEADKPEHMRGKYLNPEAYGLDGSHAMYAAPPN